MPLSADARSDLSQMLGDGYVVIDIKKAPPTANVVLTTVVNERTLGALRGLFPHARILLTEFHDRARGIDYPGPISRALDACPDGYFVAHGLESLPAIVQSEARLQLSGSTRPTRPMIDVDGHRAAAPPGPLWPPVTRDDGGIIWVNDPDPSHPVPEGLVLELEHLDHAVAGLLQTSEPRVSPLWASLVAEAAVHLAREQKTDVLVDVTGLTTATRAQLRVHATSERVRQTKWPPEGEQLG